MVILEECLRLYLEPRKKYEQHKKTNRVHSGRKALESSLLTRLMERNDDSQNITLNALMFPCSNELKEKVEK